MIELLAISLVALPPEVQWTAWPAGGIVDVECAGFIDGDSTEDVFAASGEAPGHGVMCLSGATGVLLWHNDSLPGIAGKGCLRSIRDVDEDGCRDVAVGFTSGVAVLSGSTGEVIWSVGQTHPVCWVETANGPQPSDTYVLVNRRDSYWTSCAAYGGRGGPYQWETPYVATSVDYVRATGEDYNGSGWSELVITVNRQSVSSGWEDVVDGADGSMFHREYTVYYGTADVCDTPMPLLVVSHFGYIPVMWAWSFESGSVVWSSDDYELSFSRVLILPDITGPPCPEREVLGLSGTHMTLVSMDEDYVGWYGQYTFPEAVKELGYYCEGDTWRVAIVTQTGFHCPELEFLSPSTEPSITLPNSDARDLCLLDSDLFPTPMAAVAMEDSAGPGVCAICTSWFAGGGEAPGQIGLTLEDCSPNPCRDVAVVEWRSEAPGPVSISVYDSSGRLCMVQHHGTLPGGRHAVRIDARELPAGCYLVMVSCGSGSASTRMIVLR